MGEAFMAYHSDPIVREYEDRGMAKWMGFYLSEHTSEMEKEEKNRNIVYVIREQMSQEDIFDILSEAFRKRQVVNIQLAERDDEGHAFPDEIGVIEGFETTTL